MTDIKSQMTWPRFIGLLQTDGSFLFFWDKKDKTFRPTVILTAGQTNKYLLDELVKPWLLEQDINCSIDDKKDQIGSYNLKIERQVQVKKVIEHIDENSEKYFAQLLDEKLTDYLVLKYALQRTEDKKKVRTTAERAAIFRELIDLKVILLEKNKEKNHLNSEEERKQMEEFLSVSDTKENGRVKYNSLLAQASALSDQFVKKIKDTKQNCTNYPPQLGEYIAGLIDGDGSFQVNFIIHQKQKPNYEFKPALTFTQGNLSTEKQNVFELLNLFFINLSKVQPVEDGKYSRLTINSYEVLTRVINFIDNIKLVLVKNAKRFTTLKQVVENKSKLATDQNFALLISESIELNFVESKQYRNYTREDRDLIIKDYFKNFGKSL